MKALAWCVFVVLLISTAITLQMPAAFIAHQVNGVLAASGQRWRVAEPQGHIRAGQLRLMHDADAWGNLAWTWQPTQLLRGTLRADVQWRANTALPRGEGRVTLDAGYNRVTLHNLAASFDVAALARVWPGAAFMQPHGRGFFAADRFSVERVGTLIRSDGQLDVRWQNAGVAQAAVTAIGSFRLIAKGAPDGIALVVDTLEGPLQLAGEGELRTLTRGPLRLIAGIQKGAQGDAARILQPFLANLGTPGEGDRRVLEMTLPALVASHAAQR
jgi:Type II secretion system (T2SS), protein N